MLIAENKNKSEVFIHTANQIVVYKNNCIEYHYPHKEISFVVTLRQKWNGKMISPKHYHKYF